MNHTDMHINTISETIDNPVSVIDNMLSKLSPETIKYHAVMPCISILM